MSCWYVPSDMFVAVLHRSCLICLLIFPIRHVWMSCWYSPSDMFVALLHRSCLICLLIFSIRHVWMSCWYVPSDRLQQTYQRETINRTSRHVWERRSTNKLNSSYGELQQTYQTEIKNNHRNLTENNRYYLRKVKK
jgi:hypothetical protein